MKAKDGSKVKVEYEGRFDNAKGGVFDSSSHGDHSHPLEFTVGEGRVIKGFNDAVIGMGEGEERIITMGPEEAYGQQRKELKREIPKEHIGLPEGQELAEGMMLALNAPTGEQIPALIEKVNAKTVLINLNHPLAGKTLFFKLKLVGVNN